MSDRSRPPGRRRWWALGLVGALLVVAGVGAAMRPVVDVDRTTAANVVAPAGPVASPSATPEPATPEPATPEPATPRPVAHGPAASEAWSTPLGIPADATDDERLRIKLSYDLVSLPAAQLALLLEIPGADVVSPRTLGDTAYAAVHHDAVDAVRVALPQASVIRNEMVHVDEMQAPAPSWGLDAVDDPAAGSDDAYLYDSTGAGVTAFVVDSGVQSDHPDFGGRVDAAAGHDEVGDGRGTEDCNGHGTHVAGTIGSTTYGVAKDVRIVPVRVLGCGRNGSVLDMIYGMLWILQNNAAAQSVVNMSLGSSKVGLVNDVAQDLVDEGFVVAVAAGNEAQDACNVSPASTPKLLTVGAFDRERRLAWYSNFGSCVDVLAPGSDITSTWIGSTTTTISGTSMASPHVAGLAARLLQLHPAWTTAEVQRELTTAAAAGHVSGLPAGTPNLVAAIRGLPRITAVSVAGGSAGLSVSWTTNRVGTFTSFALTVTDTTTGREYPVTVAAARSSTVFTDVRAGHSYSISVTGAARMPSGALVTTDAVTATGP